MIGKRPLWIRVLLCTLIVLGLLCAGPAHSALHADHAVASDCAACVFAAVECPEPTAPELLILCAAQGAELTPLEAPRSPCPRVESARGPPRNS